MKPGNILLMLVLGGMLLLSLAGGYGCANIIPPTGGPKDTLPPVPLLIKPADSTRNFTGKKISFTFDEYVQLDNPQQNLLVNPMPKIPPTVTSKLKVVTVEIKDTLRPNTTYTFDFGKAIKDINEGNVLRNFRYIFSTGRRLDSLTLSGRVIVAETGKPDSTLFAILHTSLDDSAVAKEKPRYVARLDSSGHFTFHNLPAGTFALYAIKDQSGTYQYTSPAKQLFAFADSAVHTAADNPPVTLYAFTEKEKPDTTAPPASPSRKGPGRAPKGKAAEKAKHLQFGTNVSGGQQDLLSNVTFDFKTPFKYFDSSKVVLTDDSLVPLHNYHFSADTSNTKVSLAYNWTPNTKYRIVLDSGFAEDTAGLKPPKNDTLAFTTKKESDYGLVKLRFLNLDLSKNPVLEFVQGDEVKYSHVFVNNQFNAKLFQPGDYNLRILYDDNKNGKWDPGAFFGKHTQPEKVLLISRKLTVKANWDNIVDVTL